MAGKLPQKFNHHSVVKKITGVHFFHQLRMGENIIFVLDFSKHRNQIENAVRYFIVWVQKPALKQDFPDLKRRKAMVKQCTNVLI